jgi:TolB-like protein
MIIAGKYEVIGELGRGGMGVVYQARHITLGSVFAVKTIPAHLARERDLVARFQQEARVMAALRHPNIVRVVDVGDDGALHFLIMECIEGETLRQILQRVRTLSIDDALHIAIDIASALEHAHRHVPAVIHRDIKPSNIIVEQTTGRAMVTDFGIAKLLGHESVLHTQTGMLVGTMKYCAPEQLTGGAVDGRADLFSLGLVLYEMISGRHPLDGFDDARVVASALDRSAEHRLEFVPSVPVSLQRLILCAVSKDRERRHPDSASMLRELALVCTSTVVATAAPQTRSDTATARLRYAAPPLAAIAALAIVVFIAGFVAERAGYWRSTGDRATSWRQAGEIAQSASMAPPSTTTRAIGVMDFAALNPDPRMQWMRDIIRDNLSGQLSAAADCKVFSKEFIDFKAQGLVEKGSYPDLRSATMKVAEDLGVSKVIFGRYRANGEQLYIDAHVVDMRTGLQEPADHVQGEITRFAELQGQLASKIMVRLDVRPAAVQIGEAADIDGYKLLLDAEGGAQPSAGGEGEQTPSKESTAGSSVVRLLAWLAPSAAHAEESAGDPSRTAILETLEKYRRAYEEKDLDLLAQVYGSLSPQQSGAATQYFATAGQLVVKIENVDIAVEGDHAVVSYTRHDHFQDAKTGRAQELQVRLTKRLVQNDGGWIIAQATK